jgi:hypothetical protein
MADETLLGFSFQRSASLFRIALEGRARGIRTEWFGQFGSQPVCEEIR